MKSLKRFILTIISIFFVLTMTNAQEVNENKSNRFGIGISIININDDMGLATYDGIGNAPVINLIIDTSPSFRIEPEIGYFVYNFERKESEHEFESTLKTLRLGVGLFVKKAKSDKFNLYYGVRTGILNTSLESKDNFPYISGTNEESSNGFYISPTVGGEYFFSDHFSMGGEAQFMYSSTSFESDDDYSDEEVTISTTSTKAIIYVRFYF